MQTLPKTRLGDMLVAAGALTEKQLDWACSSKRPATAAWARSYSIQVLLAMRISPRQELCRWKCHTSTLATFPVRGCNSTGTGIHQ